MELNLTVPSKVRSTGAKKSPEKSKNNDDTAHKQLKRKPEEDDTDENKTWTKKRPKTQNSKSFGSKNNKDYISSLFSGNPSLPDINLQEINPINEPVFSVADVSDLNVHPHLISCLENRLNIKKLTSVQKTAIPLLLDGNEALIKSQTGSGKTLAYAIPVIQDLQGMDPKIQRTDGIHAVIVLPTRELALQTYEWFHKLSYSFTRLVPGVFSGGEKRKSEKARIRKGINILVSTPGRLVDHIQNTATLVLSKVRWLILDEADRLLDMGYEKDLSVIVDAISEQAPQKRTVMLSATLSSGVESLAHINMKSPKIIDISSSQNDTHSLTNFSTPSSLKHCFSFVPAKLRLVTLVSVICEKCLLDSSDQKKAVVFLPTLDLVDFLFKLFANVLSPLLPLDDDENIFYRLHGDMKQEDRVKVFNEFRSSFCGILLTTDVAARGLELPNVDWIIQMSAPAKTEDYVHRVGRTARIGSEGHALIFLLPSEENFIKHLESSNLSLNDLKCDDLLKALLLLEDIPNESKKKKMTVEDQAAALQLHFEKSLLEDRDLRESAKKAFLSYIRAYATYPTQLKGILPFKELHLGHIAKSMCLRDAPKALGAGAFMMRQNHQPTNRHLESDLKNRPKKNFKSYKLTAVDTV